MVKFTFERVNYNNIPNYDYISIKKKISIYICSKIYTIKDFQVNIKKEVSRKKLILKRIEELKKNSKYKYYTLLNPCEKIKNL